MFNATLGATNRDVVLDYVVADDTIWLENAVMTDFPPGRWPRRLRVRHGRHHGGAPGDLHSANGQLLYDADGNGAGAAVLVATLNTGLVMTAGEFLVI